MSAADAAASSAAPVPRRGRARTAGMRAVFERDFLVVTSRGRFLILRTFVVFLPAVFLCLGLSTGLSRPGFGTSRAGQVILAASIALLPSLVLLLSPVLAASSIAAERSMNTLDIVLATPVASWAFVLAKFASRLAITMTLVAATLPLAGVAFLYGGVDVSLFLELTAYVLGLAILSTASGIMTSAWSRNVAGAGLLAYVLPIVVPLLHIFGTFAMVAMNRGGPGQSSPEDFGIALNPLYAWGEIGQGGVGFGTIATHPGLRALGVCSAVAAGALALAMWRVARESAHGVTRGTKDGRWRAMRCSNPVLDRALRGSAFDRPKVRTVLTFLVMLGLLALFPIAAAAHNDLDDAWPHVAVMAVTSVLTPLLAMSQAAHSVASERQTGALDLLLATRLRPSDVIHGKYLGAILSTIPLAAVVFVYAVVAAFFSKLDLVTVAAWAASVSVVTAALAAVGIWCSVGAANPVRAVLTTYAVVFGGSILHGALFGMFMMVSHRWVDEEVAVYLIGASPGYVGSAGIGLSMQRHWNSDEWNGLIAWILWSGAYVIGSIAVIRHAIARLRKRNETS